LEIVFDPNSTPERRVAPEKCENQWVPPREKIISQLFAREKKKT